jgi:hypothetical protein
MPMNAAVSAFSSRKRATSASAAMLHPNPCNDIGIARQLVQVCARLSSESLTATLRARSLSASSCKCRRADWSLIFSPVATAATSN